MQLLRTPDQVRAAVAQMSAASRGNDKKTVVLTPTMGGLHDGHLALARRARQMAHIAIVSIYVNPLQFGAADDYADYPRRLQADCDKLQAERLADIVYAPTDAVMYPQKQTIGISLPPMANTLCGASRPGFFQGVAAVVCKLFNQCRPHAAVFGQKDFQQTLVVRQMCAQLDLGVDIVTHPTVRAADGLALSSRNDYLTTEERARAPALYAALAAAAERMQNGAAPDAATSAGAAQLAQAGLRCDYFTARAAADLGAPAPGAPTVLLAAAWLGRARLIDNVIIGVPQPAKSAETPA